MHDGETIIQSISVYYYDFGIVLPPYKELVVGVTDRLSFGSGKEVMPYLMEGSETTLSWDLALTEAGNMGHIVPGHKYLLDLVYLV